MFTLEEKVGQMMMVGFHGTTAPKHILEWLSTGRIGGVYLFARNIESPAQVKALVDECHQAAKYPILVGIDQEGGIVARLREGFTESPGAMALGASGDTQLAEDISYMLGRELLAMGINWDFAPVADITHNINNPSVGTRSIGTDKHHVSQFVRAQIRGFQKAGVAATVKHFPGLGNTATDTHEALARITGSVDYLWEQDLIPFIEALAEDVASVMVSHVMFTELDAKYPSTLSPVIINKLLREELQYNGAVCTDCMEMKAITDNFGATESAILTVLAGVDMVMFSHTQRWQEQAYKGILTAVKEGRISEERLNQSVARIQAIKAKYEYKNPPSLDVIRSQEHLQLADQAARAGTVLLKHDNIVFPLNKANLDEVACIEFGAFADTGAMNAGTYVGFAGLLKQALPEIVCTVINPAQNKRKKIKQIDETLKTYSTILLVTRNAHLLDEQLELAQLIQKRAKNTILVCLRNPYDAGLLNDARTIICTNGDSAPSLQAGIDAVLGKFVPDGKLTVQVI